MSGCISFSFARTPKPSMPGILMSLITTSGFDIFPIAIASSPVAASAATEKSRSLSSIAASPSLTIGWSSTIISEIMSSVLELFVAIAVEGDVLGFAEPPSEVLDVAAADQQRPRLALRGRDGELLYVSVGKRDMRA